MSLPTLTASPELTASLAVLQQSARHRDDIDTWFTAHKKELFQVQGLSLSSQHLELPSISDAFYEPLPDGQECHALVLAILHVEYRVLSTIATPLEQILSAMPFEDKRRTITQSYHLPLAFADWPFLVAYTTAEWLHYKLNAGSEYMTRAMEQSVEHYLPLHFPDVNPASLYRLAQGGLLVADNTHEFRQTVTDLLFNSRAQESGLVLPTMTLAP